MSGAEVERREPEDVSFYQMQAAVGSLLFLFGRIEQETRNAIEYFGLGEDPQRFRGASSLLYAWLKLILQNEANAHLAAQAARQLLA